MPKGRKGNYGGQMMQVPRSNTSRFAQVPRAEIPRSTFDLSHGVKTTFDAGYLVPIYVDEALPGDTFNVKMTGFARLATPLKPIMDNLHMETFFFAVPNRLLWDNWQRFNGEQDSPQDSTDFIIPSITGVAPVVQEDTLADYLGLPLGLDTSSVNVSSLPFRAYALIWNEWFRDQNLQDSIPVPKGDGPDDLNDPDGFAVLMKRGKRHDYFTSALPWPQKGDSVPLPLGDQAPIAGLGQGATGGTATNQLVFESARGVQTYARAKQLWNNATGDQVFAEVPGGGTEDDMHIYADLSTATASTINELRQAFQIQKLLERDARGGTRYTEIIRSHFGVTSPDARLQRPEYLGGGHSPITISPVAQTSSTDATTPQGNLSAIGTGVIQGHGFTKSFTEHCVIIGLVSVRADLSYQQGLDRMWSRRTRFDFYWPALSHIGEQTILNKEIFVSNAAADEDVFGYQERYAEYRYHPNKITGLFRSGASLSLDIWHLAQDFASLPALGDTFIQEDPPIARIVAVPSEPHFLFDSYFRIKAARPMPVYGVPGLIDHF